MAERHVEYLLIGGGLASGNCARWLREEGAEGPVLIVGREPDLPYNRPDCSKGYLQGKVSRDDTLFRPPDWYEDQRVEALTRTSVLGLSLSERRAELSDRQIVTFDKALLATGANVRRLGVPGGELAGIHYLRTLGNSEAIRHDAAGKRVVLIGGSYIACEVAASLTADHGSTCALVMLEPIALSRGFGDQAGRFFQSRLEEHRIEIHGEDSLARFEGADGRITKVITERGLELEADAVVIGAGVVPEVTLARSAGLELGESGGVVARSTLETPTDGVYVAGDIAEYDSVIHGRPIRIEHWDVAFNHGKTAALNMLGCNQPHDVVPYFFSDLADWASLEYVGPASHWEQEVVRGSIEEGEFAIFYLDGGQVVAALSVDRSDDLEHARRLITSHEQVGDRVAELADLSTDLAEV